MINAAAPIVNLPFGVRPAHHPLPDGCRVGLGADSLAGVVTAELTREFQRDVEQYALPVGCDGGAIAGTLTV